MTQGKSGITLGHCSINGVEFSKSSKNTLITIRYKFEMHKNLVYLAGTSVVMDIFINPDSAYDKLWNISGYDWKSFRDTVGGMKKVIKEVVRKLATPMIWQTKGK
ncbi:hypothetical protein N9R79_10705 [Vibrio sp.]|nr:hypothetical protein [Vibrio sp.]